MEYIGEEEEYTGTDMPQTSFTFWNSDFSEPKAQDELLKSSLACSVEADEPGPSVEVNKSSFCEFLELQRWTPMRKWFRKIQKAPTLATVPEETAEELAAEEQEVSVSTQQPHLAAAPEEPQPVCLPETPQVPVAEEQPHVHRKCKEKRKHLIYPQVYNDPEEPRVQILQREPVTPPQQQQQTPNTKDQTPAETFYLQNGVKMIQVSENYVSEKDELTIQLKKEQALRRDLVKDFKEKIQVAKAQESESYKTAETRNLRLHVDLHEAELNHEEALQRVSTMEKDLEEEKKLQQEAETCQIQVREGNSRLVSALVQAQEDQKREKLQWEEERPGLLQTIKDQQDALKQVDTAKEDMLKRMERIREQVEEIRKKPKKPSRWKRFLNFFKR